MDSPEYYGTGIASTSTWSPAYHNRLSDKYGRWNLLELTWWITDQIYAREP